MKCGWLGEDILLRKRNELFPRRLYPLESDDAADPGEFEPVPADEAAGTAGVSSGEDKAVEYDDMVVLAPRRAPKPRRTPRILGDDTDSEGPSAEPEKVTVPAPLSLVPLTENQPDIEAPKAELRPPSAKDKPALCEPVRDVTLKPQKPKRQEEPEPEEADEATPEADVVEAEAAPAEPTAASPHMEPDGIKPSSDQHSLLPLTPSLIRPRPVRRPRFLPAPVKSEELVEPKARLRSKEPKPDPMPETVVAYDDLSSIASGELISAPKAPRGPARQSHTPLFKAPDFQHYADQFKVAMLSPRLQRLEDLLSYLGPSGLAVAGLLAIAIVMLLTAFFLNPSASTTSAAPSLPIPERPDQEGLAAEEVEAPMDPIAGIISYISERASALTDSTAISAILAKTETVEGLGQFTLAAEVADLRQLLVPGEDYTIFAPNDAAFAKLAPDEIDRLLQPEGRERLLVLLRHHILPGRLTIDDIAGNVREHTSLAGKIVTIDAEQAIRVGNAFMVEAGLEADDSVVHVIDTILALPAP